MPYFKAKMKAPEVSDVKVFVPAKNFGTSLTFYQSIGWQLNWQTEGLAEIELAGVRLYLQNFYDKSWAENFMIYLPVEDAKAWYDFLRTAVPDARINGPKQEDYGALVTYLWDPSGILLHFAQATSRS